MIWDIYYLGLVTLSRWRYLKTVLTSWSFWRNLLTRSPRTPKWRTGKSWVLLIPSEWNLVLYFHKDALSWASLTYGLNPQLGVSDVEHRVSCLYHILQRLPSWGLVFFFYPQKLPSTMRLGHPSKVGCKGHTAHTAWTYSNEHERPGADLNWFCPLWFGSNFGPWFTSKLWPLFKFGWNLA